MNAKKAKDYIPRIKSEYGTANFTRGSFAAENWFDCVDAALCKQIPKKPTYDCKSIPFRCPNCVLALDAVIGLETSYCPRCGQAIDWKGVIYDV